MKTILISAALIAVICASFTFIGTTTSLVQSPRIGTPAELCAEVSDPQDRILYEHEMQTNLFIGTAQEFGGSRMIPLNFTRHGTIDAPQSRWRSDDKEHQVTSRQLVGILLRNTPRVYLIAEDDEKDARECQKTGETVGDWRFSDAEIPRRTIRARELTAFEAYALKLLQSGSKLVTWQMANRIRAMGAIRAEQSCTRCHDEKPGEMLGAFTYFITVGSGVHSFMPLSKEEIEMLTSIKSFPIEPEAKFVGKPEQLKSIPKNYMLHRKEDQEAVSRAHRQMSRLAQDGMVTDAMVAAVREYREQHEKWVAAYEDGKPVRLKKVEPPSDK